MNRLATDHKYPRFTAKTICYKDHNRSVFNSHYANDMLAELSHCNPTDHLAYKNWIAYWKKCYAVATFMARHEKESHREHQRFWSKLPEATGPGPVCVPPETLMRVREFANMLLRQRQQMKTLNRLYMQTRKDRINNV